MPETITPEEEARALALLDKDRIDAIYSRVRQLLIDEGIRPDPGVSLALFWLGVDALRRDDAPFKPAMIEFALRTVANMMSGGATRVDVIPLSKQPPADGGN